MDFLLWTGIAFLIWFALVLLFTPGIDYRVIGPRTPESEGFLHVLQYSTQAAVHPNNAVQIFTNGERFYPAMRDAIRCAQSSIHLEAYIIQPGHVADMLFDALIERARAGVEVRVVADAIGSLRLVGAPARRLREAGCQLRFYQPIRWYRLHRLNNRTHRELLVIDGRIAFTGGAGIADWWYERTSPSAVDRMQGFMSRTRPYRRSAAWRDTMVRIEGPIVAALQGVFAENWLECCGEILASPHVWPPLAPAGQVEAMLVKSSPSDRATSSRVVFQMLIEGARESIDIHTPYFLPDAALRRALVQAAQRGVRVRAIVPGSVTDQRLVRLASRRMYRELLEGGVRIFEYRPSMTHAKVLLVDNTWAVVGTTNMDNRSFEHNDEINVAFRDRDVTERLGRDFARDLQVSQEITLQDWERRPLFEKIVGPVCWILERQQ